MIRWLATGLALLLALQAPLAHADPEAEAKALYDRAQTHYSLGQFTEAIDLYKQAYERSKRPSLLYNIAQSYRLSQDPKNAKFFYESYLRAVPDAANRADVEARIVEMDEAIAAAPKPQPAPVPVAPPEPTTRRVGKPGLTIAGIAGLGLGAVGIGLGVFFGMRASDFEEQVDSAMGSWSEELEAAEKDGKSANTMMYVMYGVGGTLLVGGAVLLWMGRPRTVTEAPRTTFLPVVTPDGVGVSLQGSF